MFERAPEKGNNVQVPTIDKHPICVVQYCIKYGYLSPSCFFVHVIQKAESALAITLEVELLRTNL